MKNTKFLVVAFVLLAASWAMEAVNLTGTWKAETVSARGTAEQTMTFKQTGDSFEGELLTSQGDKQVIKNGTVKGDKIEFTVERPQAGGGTASVAYKGTVKGDEITGSFTGASGATVEWKAKREK